MRLDRSDAFGHLVSYRGAELEWKQLSAVEAVCIVWSVWLCGLCGCVERVVCVVVWWCVCSTVAVAVPLYVVKRVRERARAPKAECGLEVEWSEQLCRKRSMYAPGYASLCCCFFLLLFSVCLVFNFYFISIQFDSI